MLNALSLTSIAKAIFILAAAMISHSAFALGGLDTANNTIIEIRNGIYLAVGSFAGLYLLVMVVLVKLEKKSWGDLFSGMMYVAIAGGIVLLSTWLFSLFANG